MALAAIHSLAVTAIAVSDVALAVKAALLGAIAISLFRSVKINVLRSSPRAVVALMLHENGAFEMEYRSGRLVRTTIDASSVVSPWLTVLRLRHDAARRSSWLALLPDAMEAADYRRLRIWLRRQAVA